MVDGRLAGHPATRQVTLVIKRHLPTAQMADASVLVVAHFMLYGLVGCYCFFTCYCIASDKWGIA